MEFLVICDLFNRLEKRSRRLEKILLLRDFLLANKKEARIVYDILAKNYQRELNKKSIGISLKTIFSTLSSISKTDEPAVEKEFNKLGDIGEVALRVLESNKQQSLLSRRLTLKSILDAFDEISSISGTNANKKKKEILSNLFLSASSPLEYKYLSRLLIDDLRVGVSEGVLREAALNAYFPQIIGLHLICDKCGYLNLNMASCFRCSNKLNAKTQQELAEKRYNLAELETPKKETSLLDYDIEYEINTLEYALRRDRERYFLKTKNPRELYNSFMKIFERKYNLLNSFSQLLDELDSDMKNVLNFQIILGNPIKVMLGPATTTMDEAFEITGMPALLDFKYDGLRVQIHNDKGDVRLFSRNLDDITKQFPEVVDFIKRNFSDIRFVLDTECVGYDFKKGEFLPFQVLSRRIMTKEISDVSHINIVVKAFDILYLNSSTLIEESYKRRRELLEGLYLNRKLRQKLHFSTEDLKRIKN